MGNWEGEAVYPVCGIGGHALAIVAMVARGAAEARGGYLMPTTMESGPVRCWT